MANRIPDEVWQDIYNDFVTRGLTSKQLSKNYDIKQTTIEAKASRERWQEARAKFQEELKEERQQQAREIKSEKFRKMDETFFMLVQGLLYELCQSHRKRLEEEKSIKPYEATQIATAIKTCYDLSKDMEGDVATALQVLMQNNVLSDDKAEEIIEVLNEGEVEVKRKISGILQGENVNTSEYQLPSQNNSN